MQLQSRIIVQSQDFGRAARGNLALQVIVVDLANNARVRTGFDAMRGSSEHRRRIARFQRLSKAGRTYPQAWQQSHLADPNLKLGAMLDKVLLGLFGLHVPQICVPLLQAFLAMEWMRLAGGQARMAFSLNGTPARISEPDFSTMTSREKTTATRQYAKKLAQAQTPRRGRAPHSKTVTIRNVRWYVRHVLQGVSIGTLAREYHQAEHPNQNPSLYEGHRRLIVRSVRNTADLLSLPTSRS